MSNNQKLTDGSTNSQYQDKEAAARCLKEYLEVHGRNSQTYDILKFLAVATLQRLADGKKPEFNYIAIQEAVTGKTDDDPSKWFRPHWKRINGDFSKQCLEGIQKYAADRGLTFYPWVAKQESNGGAGNQALIYLVATPLANTIAPSDKKLPNRDIDYIPAENLELSWWARLLFDRNQVAKGWQKWLLIWPKLLWLVVVFLLCNLLLLHLQQIKTPITPNALITLIFIGLLAWYVRNRFESLSRLIDDQIIMASEQLVSLHESGVCLELFKPSESEHGTPKRARLVKYAGTCPICSAQVLLDKGEPDFPRRIVGRCQESPREHVFSFDRATRSGYRLR